HDMEFVARHFQRVLVFQDGRVLPDDTAEAIFAQPELLAAAGLHAPPITRLGPALGLSATVLTVEAFVEAVRAGEGCALPWLFVPGCGGPGPAGPLHGGGRQGRARSFVPFWLPAR